MNEVSNVGHGDAQAEPPPWRCLWSSLPTSSTALPAWPWQPYEFVTLLFSPPALNSWANRRPGRGDRALPPGHPGSQGGKALPWRFAASFSKQKGARENGRVCEVSFEPQRNVLTLSSEGQGLAGIPSPQHKLATAVLLASGLGGPEFARLPARPLPVGLGEKGEPCPALSNSLCYLPTDGNCSPTRQMSTGFPLRCQALVARGDVVGSPDSALTDGKHAVWAPQQSPK